MDSRFDRKGCEWGKGAELGLEALIDKGSGIDNTRSGPGPTKLKVGWKRGEVASHEAAAIRPSRFLVNAMQAFSHVLTSSRPADVLQETDPSVGIG